MAFLVPALLILFKPQALDLALDLVLDLVLNLVLVLVLLLVLLLMLVRCRAMQSNHTNSKVRADFLDRRWTPLARSARQGGELSADRKG